VNKLIFVRDKKNVLVNKTCWLLY